VSFYDLGSPERAPVPTPPKGSSQSPPLPGQSAHLPSPVRHEPGAASAARYPGLLSRVLREVSDAELLRALDDATVRGETVAEFVEWRAGEIAKQLVRDAAPKALRELRRITPPNGMAL
jgi:hypothetical protein